MLVTASVDRIELVSRLDLSRDLVMRGQVVWTGRSSMDICMQLFQVCRHSMMRKAHSCKDSIADDTHCQVSQHVIFWHSDVMLERSNWCD